VTVTWSTNESIINWTSSDDPAVTFQVVKIAGGTGGGGGGVTDHGDLTGLADDDHDQYQYVNAVYTEADPFTITDESAVVTQGAAITLPAATSWQNRSVMIVAAAVDLTVTCHAGDTIAVTGGYSSTLSIPSQNIYQLTSTNFGGTWRWLQTARFGPAFDMPYWYGQSITAGHVIKMGASAPEWGAVTPGAHASTHANGGADEVSLDASQTTSGVFNAARLGTGTADAYHFLDGSGVWQDNVPVLVPIKNTSAATINKGAPVYATGSVGASGAVEVAAADADVAAKMPAIGLAETQLAVNATGYCVVVGVLRNVNTGSYSINDPLYVSTTAGELTGTKPTGASELIQNIGRVTRVNASTGEILVLGPGRTNDVPNAIDAGKLTSGTVATARLASTGTADATTFLRGDQSWSSPTTLANDTLWDAAGDLAVGSGSDTAAKLSKGTRTQALVVGASTLEWDANHYNGGNHVTATVSGAIAETIPAGAGFGATTGGASGVVHLHGIYLPKGVTITTISFVSGATAAGTPTNQWFALCDSGRNVLRVTSNDTTTAWNSSTVKSLNLTSTFTTTYSGLHYLACCVTATTAPSFRGCNAGTFTGVAVQSFTSTTGQTTPVAEGTTFAASTGRLSQALGIVS